MQPRTTDQSLRVLSKAASSPSTRRRPMVVPSSQPRSMSSPALSRLIRTASTPRPPPSQMLIPQANSRFAASTSSQSTGGSAIRPSLATNRRTMSRTSPLNTAQVHNANLRHYYWLTLTEATVGSLWMEVSEAPEFDMNEIERLFSASSQHARNGTEQRRIAAAPRVEKVHLIALGRAFNCEIMLAKIKVFNQKLLKSILLLDDSSLDVDQLENLVKYCPTQDEMNVLQGYTGAVENLGECEQFFLQMMRVPRVEEKLRACLFKKQFASKVSDIRKSLETANSAAEEIRGSTKLKCIMQAILSLGNTVNQGTARGSAFGFQLESLLKLTDTRARNSKITLMHYLCKVIAERRPELLEFPKDLTSLEAATKIQLNYLENEIQSMSNDLIKVAQELSASQSDGDVSDSFCKNMKDFPKEADLEVTSLFSLNSLLVSNANDLILYFGEESTRCPFERVMSILFNFTIMFTRAHLENCRLHNNAVTSIIQPRFR